MASRLSPSRSFPAALAWLFWAGAAVCLTAWWAVRLRVFLGERSVPAPVLLAGAGALSAALVLALVRFDAVEKLCLPWGRRWPTALAAAPAFLLGAAFDISYAMPYTTGPRIIHPLFRLLCHGGNGLLTAFIVLALLQAGRELAGVGKVGWRQLLALWVLLNAVTALYVFTARTVYYWDVAGYWSVARSLARQPLNYAHLRDILVTTITLDYNHLLAFPISLVMRVLGGSRAVFLFCLSNFYTFPALWGLAAIVRDKKWGGLVLAGLFPMLVYTGLDGFVDTASAALAIWAYAVYASGRKPVSRGVMSGALLVGTFLLRRYFFFFAASFGVAALLKKLLFERRIWADFLALFFSCGVCSVTFTYVFLLEQVAGNNYRDAYSAYDLGLLKDFSYISRYFGLGILLVILAFGVCALAKKDLRPDLFFCLSQMAVCYVAFISIQTHGLQHLMMYLPALAGLAAGGVLLSQPVAAAVAAAAATVSCLIPGGVPTLPAAGVPVGILPDMSFYGPRRPDTGQLLALADYVDGLSAGGPRTAVVLASSFDFNSETLTNLRPSLNLPTPQVTTTIRYQGTVDKRDPFNWNTATADYLIVGDPVQVHLGEENQQVMALLAHDVLEGTGPGAAYEPLDETFSLMYGVTARIYRRTRDWTEAERRSLSDRLTALYPDYASLYAAP